MQPVFASLSSKEMNGNRESYKFEFPYFYLEGLKSLAATGSIYKLYKKLTGKKRFFR